MEVKPIETTPTTSIPETAEFRTPLDHPPLHSVQFIKDVLAPYKAPPFEKDLFSKHAVGKTEGPYSPQNVSNAYNLVEFLDQGAMDTFDNEMLHLKKAVESGNDDDLDRATLATFKMLIAAIQQRIAENSNIMTLLLAATAELQQENRNLRPELLDHLRNQKTLTNQGKIVDFTADIMMGIAVSALLASIATSGGTLAPILSVVGGLGTGFATSTKGVMEHKLSKQQGEIALTQFSRRENVEKIKKLFADLRTSNEDVQQSWQNLTRIAKEWHQAAKMK